MAKKKKMTKAQAAAARRDTTPKRTYTPATTKDEGPKSKDNKLFMMIIPLVTIAVVVILSMVFTIGPGMLFGK